MSADRFYPDDQANAKRTDFGRVAYLMWLILLTAAAVIYEFSSNEMLSAAMLATHPGWGSLWLSVVMPILMFVALFAMIPVYAWLSPRVIARGPEDCWPE